MDYKDFVANFKRVACVLSVDLKETNSDNRYFVVDANDAYKRTVVKDIADFECNIPYTRYIPKAANFETLCNDCVTKNVPVHTYFDIELYNAWMEVFFMPLVSDDPDKGMILFSYEMNPKADIDKLADISSETAANVLKTCLMLRETEDFQETMNAVVADIREQCGAKRCSILLTDYEKREYKLLSEDYGNDPNQVPLAAFLTEEFYRVIETWPRLIKKSNCFVIENEQDMIDAHKIAPEWIDSLRGDNVRTLVIYPLRSDNKTIGYIWAGNFDPEKTLMIKETLGITAFILSAEIASEQNVRKMKIMSSTDLLTGVYNRNAMNNRITEDTNGTKPIKKPFGVCFIDVNGLKATNDSKGHLEGDAMLKDVAAILKELKTKTAEIYRVGGDEFMIIASGMEKASFEDYVKTLKENCELPNRTHFALGACHSEDAEGEDVRKAMQKADALMYEVKAEYYSRHPEMDWHNKIS
ncbi:MAG: sensor domain-containing diguanylate cyclase [Clostridiales bacterium]|nr:sensor domain-containing diguanylate cyclase [Clostridiales bacterium]